MYVAKQSTNILIRTSGLQRVRIQFVCVKELAFYAIGLLFLMLTSGALTQYIILSALQHRPINFHRHGT